MADATPQSPDSSPEAAPTPDLGKESFADLLDESLGKVERLEGSVLKGTVVAIEGDVAVVDVGLKSEGRVALKEFAQGGQSAELVAGGPGKHSCVIPSWGMTKSVTLPLEA